MDAKMGSPIAWNSIENVIYKELFDIVSVFVADGNAL